MFKELKIKNFNFLLLLSVLSVSVVGILVIQSATINTGENLAGKQMMGIILGVILLLIAAFFDYHYLINLSWPIYIVLNALLIAVIFFGDSSHGATRWIELPVIGTFQPSEIAKIGLIVFFSMFLNFLKDRINKVSSLLIIIGLLAIPVGFVLAQPNLSTSIVIIVMIFCMLFVAGLSYKWIFGTAAVVIPSFLLLIYMVAQGKQTFLLGYQVRRILSWISPAENTASYYQQANSIMAIGSGMLWGKGLNNTAVDSVKNGNFLSEFKTDFIFSVIGEEMGFLGSLLVIGLLAFIIFECFLTAARAKDLTGRLICTGVMSLIAFQSFTNIAVVTGIFPNTGLPLPFISYGVTSLVSMYIGIGLVLNVGLYGKK